MVVDSILSWLYAACASALGMRRPLASRWTIRFGLWIS